ncbi:MAG: MgtC/SapB family protein, partial [Clostridia bacterium]|nr:MgtC/SapB family protein [Clostridia bacterium]
MEFFREIWEMLVREAPFMLRLLVACVCGCAIGVERSLRNKEAGIRTHIVVAIGAALAMVLSKYAFFDSADADASRIASQIITGISFLGAGVIFVRGATIRGLTTAAGIWTTAVIGMAIGTGMYPLGIFTTVLMVVLQ